MNSLTSSSEEASWGRCLRLFAGVVVFGGALIFAFVAAVDPYDSGRFGWLGIHGVDDRAAALADASRARDPQFDSAIISNSTGQRLSPVELSQATGLHFAQLASPGADPHAQLAILDFFIRNHRSIGAVVVVADIPWCMHQSTMPPGGNPFPFWLYGENNTLEYAGRIFSWRGIEHAIQRVKLGLGRPRRNPIDGSFNYEEHFPPNRHPAAVPPAPQPVFTGKIDDPFPIVKLLAGEIKKLPAGAAVVLMVPPTFYTIVPQPGSRDAAEQQACDAALRSIIAGRPHSKFIDYRVDNALTRNPENFVDLIHYRLAIARGIQQGIVAGIRLGHAARIVF
jgi:hypothetical protein